MARGTFSRLWALGRANRRTLAAKESCTSQASDKSVENLQVQGEILIVSNAPGELAAWVRPVVGQLRHQYPKASVTIALVPCPYASGQEATTLAAWNQNLQVWPPKQTLRYMLTGLAPRGSRIGKSGVVLFLGGDQIFGVLLAKRSGFPLLVYTESIGRWALAVDRFLLADQGSYLAMRGRHVAPRKLSLVGNLMVDSVRTRSSAADTRKLLGLSPDSLVVGLLPGSKPFKVFYITPFFLRVAELLAAHNPSLQFILHQSPFTPLWQLEQAIGDERYARATGGTTGRLIQGGHDPWIETAGGCRIKVVPPEHQYDAMAVDDLALTVPGTNTAELAVLGIPMVVALPLNRPEEIPLEGLIGRIGAIPLVGRWIKRAAVRQVSRHVGLVALPNRRMGKMVTPERIGVLSPDIIAQEGAAILDSELLRRQIKLNLLQAMGYPGAAAAVAEVIGQALSGLGAGRLLPI